ncbi:FecR domain-containing protein [Lentisphaera marina]|uniref:LamG-like jellyroll fold domain-containing protein n=1 Tax=Lentisphaera marina TaxID=1111041 RepID=UPI002366E3A0|nr:LamG-like jellyroll fold domain-containing protein [Lentisphaera marina]MDD7986870.1 FecR domain-containing protein [Lentisphaera marina]
MEIEKLAELYLRNELNDEQRVELKEILKNDDEQSRVFAEYLYETGQLLNAAEQLSEIRPQLQALEAEVDKSNKNWFRPFLAMAALFVAVFAIWSIKNQPIKNEPIAEVQDLQFLARVNSSELGKFESGQWLQKGKYFFDEKLALTLDSGVELNVEAASEIDLIGSNKVRLHKGQVQAYVPQVAVGFVLQVPGGKVVDLGTEFLVSVNQNGLADVEVKAGEVELRSSQSDQEMIKLRENQSAALTMAGSIVNGESSLASLDTLPNLLEQRELNYVHWPFDRAELGWTPSTAGGDYHDRFRAELKDKKGGEGPQFTEGAFGYALGFDGKNDWAETDFMGVSGSRPRTVSFWVKIPKDAKQGDNYSFVSWGNSREKGEKWQIGWNALAKDGVLGAIRTEFKEGCVVGETDLRDGRWHHIVSLFIGGDNADVATHVRHYVDGRLEAISGVRRERVSTNIDSINSKPVTFGRKMDGPKYFLKAKMDELYIIDAAVTPRQVRRLMERNSLY